MTAIVGRSMVTALLLTFLAYEVQGALVGEWTFTDLGTGTIADVSGNPAGLSGALGSGNSHPTFVPGQSGDALSFSDADGAADTVSIADNDDALKLSSLTLVMRVKADATIGVFDYLASKGLTNGQHSYGFYGAGGLTFYVSSSSLGLFEAALSDISPASLWNGEWHEIMGTYEQSTKKVALYVDGVEQNPGSPTLLTGGGIGYNDLPLAFGTVSQTNGLSLGDAFGFTGQIDHARLFDVALAPGELPPEVSAIPISPALPLLASAIAGLGFVGWRRKQSA